MSKKWKNFTNARTSTIDLKNPNIQRSQLRSDWFRAATAETDERIIRVNGVKLSEIAKQYSNFSEEKNVIEFFERGILKEFEGTPEKKEEALEYLKKTMHQGGLMYPVSATIAMSFRDDNDEIYATINNNTLTQEVNFQTTKKGFKVQEYVGLPDISLFSDDDFISSDKGSDVNIIDAEGTVDVDFTSSASEPTLTIESNKIIVNHSELSSKLDNRGWGQRMLDFLKNLVGLNKNVKDLSAIKEVSDESDVELMPPSNNLSP